MWDELNGRAAVWSGFAVYSDGWSTPGWNKGAGVVSRSRAIGVSAGQSGVAGIGRGIWY